MRARTLKRGRRMRSAGDSQPLHLVVITGLSNCLFGLVTSIFTSNVTTLLVLTPLVAIRTTLPVNSTPGNESLVMRTGWSRRT